jgi:hypothetical protein
VKGDKLALTSVMLAVFAFAGAGAVKAEDAASILRAMSDYIGAQKNVTATFESDVEVMTRDLQKIQFTSSGRLQLVRPDKLHVTRTGGYADIELLYDGKTVLLRDKDRNISASAPAPATVDALIEDLRSRKSIEMPGADFLLSKVADELMRDALKSSHVGRGIVDGVECEHLAFRNADVDWQIWIESGSRPIPRKYVITSKTLAGAPQYTLRISNWSDSPIDVSAYTVPETGAKVVGFEDLWEIDEVPAGTEESKP